MAGKAKALEAAAKALGAIPEGAALPPAPKPGEAAPALQTPTPPVPAEVAAETIARAKTPQPVELGRTPTRNINLKRVDLETAAGAEQVLDSVSIHTDNAGYGKQTFEELRAATDALDDKAVLEQLMGAKPGELLDAPRLKKARQIMLGSASDLFERARSLADDIETGAVSDLDLIEFARQHYRHVAIQNLVQGQTRAVARALTFLRDTAGPRRGVTLDADSFNIDVPAPKAAAKPAAARPAPDAAKIEEPGGEFVYHLTDPKNLESVRVGGLVPDKDGFVYAFDGMSQEAQKVYDEVAAAKQTDEEIDAGAEAAEPVIIAVPRDKLGKLEDDPGSMASAGAVRGNQAVPSTDLYTYNPETRQFEPMVKPEEPSAQAAEPTAEPISPGWVADTMRVVDREKTLDLIRTIANQPDPVAASRETGRVGVLDWSVNGIIAYRAVQLLSGPKTLVRNLVGSAFANLTVIPERALAAGIGRALGTGAERVRAGESMAMLYADAASALDGVRMAAKAFLANRSAFGAARLQEAGGGVSVGFREDGLLGPVGKSLNALRDSPTGKGLNFIGSTLMLPGRALLASDEFFKVMAYRQELHALAYRTATREGLEGEAFSARIAELTDPVEGAKKAREAAEQAQAAGDLNEVGRARLAETDFIELHRRSSNFADVQTFQDSLRLNAAKKFEELRNGSAIARLIVPFYRSVANVLNYGAIERSPLGLLHPAIREELAAGGVRRDMAAARLLWGTSVTTAFGALVWNGKLSGAGPTDPERKKLYMEAGWRPYSVKIDGEWVSYKGTDPMTTSIAAIADMLDVYRQPSSIREQENIGLIAVSSFASSLTDKTFLVGVSDFFDWMGNVKEGRASGYSARLGASFMPYNAMVRSFTSQGGDPRRMTIATDAMEWAKNEVLNIYNPEALPPQVNMWGEIARYDEGVGPDPLSPFYSSRYAKDEPTTEMLTNFVPVVQSPPEFTFAKGRINVHDVPDKRGEGWAAYRYYELIGQMRHKTVSKVIASSKYNAAPYGAPNRLGFEVTRGDLLEEAMTAGATAGRQLFIKEYEKELLMMAEQTRSKTLRIAAPPGFL